MIDLEQVKSPAVEAIQILIDVVSVFVAVVLACLILYANSFLLRRRKRELGTYLLLGLSQGQVSRLLGIGDCLDKYPYQMSGGQQQRCAAARAIVTHPALVLADEPTGALDSKSARMLLERLEVLNRERGTTILMVTHDAFTASCCRRVVFLRDGQIFQELSRGELDRRAFFAQIIRVITLLGGEMEDVL